jgi:hypothetical protein
MAAMMRLLYHARQSSVVATAEREAEDEQAEHGEERHGVDHAL